MSTSATPHNRRAVFLDRDGVLNRSEVRNGKPYAPNSIENFVLYDEAAPALRSLADGGFALVVVTNQPDVGNGHVARAIVEEMHTKLRKALPVEAIEACYHAQTANCDCRKPKPGMLHAAANRLAIDLPSSFMVGDRWSDISAGRAAGCQTILIDRGYAEPMPETPDLVVSSLTEAGALILGATETPTLGSRPNCGSKARK
jgi:D-glycero-D-manno-heptose 1,7-bisphosphate phosphatase